MQSQGTVSAQALHAGGPTAAACRRARSGDKRQLVYVFSPRGSQWFGMGRDLLRDEPVFAEQIERCTEHIRRFCGWSLRDELLRPADGYRLTHDEAVFEPAVVAIQVGICAVLESRGLKPDAVIGASGGEFTAAHVAGGLTLEDTMRAACAVSRAFPVGAVAGGLVVVGLGAADTQTLVEQLPGEAHVAAHYGPDSSVVAAEDAVLEVLLRLATAQQFRARRLATWQPFHSPLIEARKREFLAHLEGVEPGKPGLPVYSAFLGGRAGSVTFTRQHWWEMLRQPVRFVAAAEALLADGYDTFVEVAPSPLLLDPLRESPQWLERSCVALPSMLRDRPADAVLKPVLRRLAALGLVRRPESLGA